MRNKDLTFPDLFEDANGQIDFDALKGPRDATKDSLVRTPFAPIFEDPVPALTQDTQGRVILVVDDVKNFGALRLAAETERPRTVGDFFLHDLSQKAAANSLEIDWVTLYYLSRLLSNNTKTEMMHAEKGRFGKNDDDARCVAESLTALAQHANLAETKEERVARFRALGDRALMEGGFFATKWTRTEGVRPLVEMGKIGYGNAALLTELPVFSTLEDLFPAVLFLLQNTEGNLTRPEIKMAVLKIAAEDGIEIKPSGPADLQ